MLQRFDYPDGRSLRAPRQKIFLVTAESSDLVAIALGFGTRPERARDIHYRSFQRRSLSERHGGFWTVKVLSILCAKKMTSRRSRVCVAYRGMRE